MKVQIISDIHLEFYKDSFNNFSSIIKKDPECDILFLAGDIGHIECKIYKPFLQYVSDNWEEIYYVLGNHEFYQINNNIDKIKSYEKLLEYYDALMLEYWNIHLLTEKNNDIHHIFDKKNGTLYFILGNIGWSFANINTIPYCRQPLNDYNYIYTSINNRKLYINNEWMLNKHIECLKNINLSLTEKLKFEKIQSIEDIYAENVNEVKFICLTHFPFADYEKVSLQNKKYNLYNDPLKPYFCNYYDKYKKYLEFYDILIAGHTHYSYNYKNNNVRFISNQKGYKDEARIHKPNYNPSCVFNI
jgi:predicted phosphodiesterase